MHASRALLPLLALLSPAEATPQIVLQTLRTLNSFADSSRLSTLNHVTINSNLSDLLYTEDALRNLLDIILQTSLSLVVHQQISLVASLITKTCREEHHRKRLIECDILDALAAQLASWVTDTLVSSYNGVSLPEYTRTLPDDRLLQVRPRLSSLLHAIAVIIQHSKNRAHHLLRTSPIGSVFQRVYDQSRAVYENYIASLPASQRTKIQIPDMCVENLLPSVSNPYPRTAATSSLGFPPLDAIKSSEISWPKSLSTAVEIFSSNGLEHIGDEESPLIPWLIYIIRTFDEMTGLMATILLAILYRLRLIKKSRETSIALLVMPPLVRMLDRDLKFSECALHPTDSSITSSMADTIKEEAPATLAMLTINNPRAQKAAVDAGAIKKLSQLLKDSYDPVDANPNSSMWSSEPSEQKMTRSGRDDLSEIGPPGLSPVAYHTTKVRETTLIALAALASDKDEYRKAIIENGVIPFIIRTLKAEDVKFAVSSNTETLNDEGIERKIIYGNCREAILAACGATRALSRSVSTLRTSLMDAGLAAPLFALLKCQDLEIKIAATAVVCNLVLEFSPMREVDTFSL